MRGRVVPKPNESKTPARARRAGLALARKPRHAQLIIPSQPPPEDGSQPDGNRPRGNRSDSAEYRQLAALQHTGPPRAPVPDSEVRVQADAG